MLLKKYLLLIELQVNAEYALFSSYFSFCNNVVLLFFSGHSSFHYNSRDVNQISS